MTPNNKYWASDNAHNAVLSLKTKKDDFYSFLNNTGIMNLWGSVYSEYYHATSQGPYGGSAGEWNEFQNVSINDFRNLIQHKCGLVINQKPTWEPMAVNSDIESLAQTKLAKSLLEYYQDAKRLSVKANNMVLSAALFGEGYLLQTWDATVGNVTFANIDDYGNPSMLKEGDIDQRVFEPVDVIRDVQVTDSEQNHWYMTRETRNKWDLCAKYPEYADLIAEMPFTRDIQEHYINYIDYQTGETDDLVILYRFLHKKTASLPKGRMIEFLSEDIILRDNELPYEDFPLHRIIDTEIQGRNFAYTDSFDMLEIQGLTNGLWSTVMTNLRAFGVQNVLLPEGSNISETHLGGQLNVITFDPNGPPPSALQLCAQPNGIWDAMNALNTKLETISGVNSTARGNPPAAVGSGVALSMLQSLNVQYSQGLQSSYVSVMEQIGTALINILRNYANTPRTVAIVGKANASYIREYDSSDLEQIHRVTVKLGNPMSNTPQGRFTMGQMLCDQKLITDASQLLTVFETGSLDTLTEGRDAQLMLSKQIVEALREGKPVPEPMITDDHKLMLTALRDLTSDMSLRLEHPELLPPILTQIQKHMAFLQDTSIAILLTALGQTPLPPNAAINQGLSNPGQGTPPNPAAPGGNLNINSTVNAPSNINPNNNAIGQAATSTAQANPQAMKLNQTAQTGPNPNIGKVSQPFTPKGI